MHSYRSLHLQGGTGTGLNIWIVMRYHSDCVVSMKLDSRLCRDGLVMLVSYEDLICVFFFVLVFQKKKKVNRTVVISEAFWAGVTTCCRKANFRSLGTLNMIHASMRHKKRR
jgi:hypothetical protein